MANTYSISRAAFLSRIRQFKNNQSGAIAMLFALVLVPLLLSIGIAIDYGRASSYEWSMQRVLDEAVISGATELAKSNDTGKAEVAARRRFEATKPTSYDIALSVSADEHTGKIKAEATSHVSMMFMAIAGYKNLEVSADAVAASKRPKSTRKLASKGARRLPKLPQLSDSKIRDVVYRVNEMCYKLRQLGMADRVPQCQAVFDGSFEKKLRARLASKGNATSLLPGGVRLVQ